MTEAARTESEGKERYSTLFLAIVGMLSVSLFGYFGVMIYERLVVGAYGNDPAALAFMVEADPRVLSAGDMTSFRYDDQAFTEPAANLDWRRAVLFDEGDGHLERPFIPAEKSSLGANNDGLGPLYNATSCEACHQANGRTLPVPGQGYLVRLSVPGADEHGGPKPHPFYGGQFGDISVPGIAAEGKVDIIYSEVPGRYGDGTPFTLMKPEIALTELAYGPMGSDTMMSARAPLSLYGLGLLEAIDEEQLLSWTDPDDADGDGISGRINRVWDFEFKKMSIGRFGWKAEQPSLMTQSADAAANDMGVTTALLPNQTCTDAQPGCKQALHGINEKNEELDYVSLIQTAGYMQFLAVPARGHVDHPMVMRGEQLFAEIGCSSCHLSEVTTGHTHEYSRLHGQRIQPFTDLLLHDMGEGLSDNRPSFDAEGREWRTPPLWGLGLLETVNGHTRLLHDGRARDFAEAILWHGGEAAAAKEAFRLSPAEDREAIIKFLKSL